VGEAVEDRPAPAEQPVGWSEEVIGALACLDPDQRAAVVLRHLLEYTPGEIARLLEVPRGTVNSRLRRALDRLAGELERPASAEPAAEPAAEPPSEARP
jgi:RNA polymerase sigma-70 factor (ECF subfamily)